MNLNGSTPQMDAGSPEESGFRFDFRISAAREVLATGDSLEESMVRSRLSLARQYRWIRIANLGLKYRCPSLFREARHVLIGSAGQDGMARAEAVQVAAGTVSPAYVSQAASSRGNPLSRFLNRKSRKLEAAEGRPE